jgi:tetratricopeptide (TPR) repeat protein
MQDSFARSWRLTRYLLFAPERQGQLRSFITAINQQQPPLTAARTAFGDLKQLETQLDAFPTSVEGVTRLSAASIPIEPVEMRRLTAAEAATVDIRVRLRRGVDAGLAPLLLHDAEAAAAPYPNDPIAQATLAQAAAAAGDYKLAIEAAERAVTADPKNIEAHLVKGQMIFRAALAVGGNREEGMAAGRREFIAANKINPDDPRPLFAYYLSYWATTASPPQNARDALARAFELAPIATQIRMSMARQQLFDRQTGAARVTLLPVAFGEHRNRMGDLMRALVSAIDTGHAADLVPKLASSRLEEATDEAH